MKRILLLAAIVLLPLLGGALALAAGAYGTAEDARALLERAVSELKADEGSALAKFNSGADGFKDRDLYVFCVTPDGNTVAHADSQRIGQNLGDLKDSTGKEFGKEIINTAKEGQVSKVDYMFARPGGTKAVPKQSYITRIGNLICGVGYYK